MDYYHETDVTVSWDGDNNRIHVDWRNTPSQQTVRNGCEAILELLVARKAGKVFNDNRGITGTWVRASNWVADDWLPRMIAAGLTRLAWIESPMSTLSVISAKKSARKYQEVIKLFKDGAEAEKWLTGQGRQAMDRNFVAQKPRPAGG